ncbi:MAG: cytochrome b/b6 domain-containing protein [Pseudomonadota bacterium]
MTETATSAPPERRIAVWDLPLRLCHWGFAVLIPAMWWTAENSEWAWHKRCGLILLGLLLFRIIWGFIGSRTARFASFVRGPGAVLSYLRGGGAKVIGHNPLGALSVMALLLAMLAQVGMGLFAGDPFDGATGPLNSLVGVMTADTLTDWHEMFFDVIVVLVGLHLAAILFYAVVKRRNLIGPMVSGRRVVSDGEDGIGAVPWVTALITAAVSAGLVIWIANGAPPLS